MIFARVLPVPLCYPYCPRQRAFIIIYALSITADCTPLTAIHLRSPIFTVFGPFRALPTAHLLNQVAPSFVTRLFAILTSVFCLAHPFSLPCRRGSPDRRSPHRGQSRASLCLLGEKCHKVSIVTHVLSIEGVTNCHVKSVQGLQRCIIPNTELLF